LNKNYIKTLEEKGLKSPVSWNSKTRAIILGHPFALEYLQTAEYKERKNELENTT